MIFDYRDNSKLLYTTSMIWKLAEVSPLAEEAVKFLPYNNCYMILCQRICNTLLTKQFHHYRDKIVVDYQDIARFYQYHTAL